MPRFAVSRIRRLAGPAAAGTLAAAVTACGPGTATHMAMPPASSASSQAMPSMSGMAAMAGGAGLLSTADGYQMTSRAAFLAAGKPVTYTFAISGPDGKPVTDFAVDQTKRLHFYVIRSDLTGFQHVHPVMSPEGTWAAPLAALRPGHWRLFASFTPATGPGKGAEFVLSRAVTVRGAAPQAALPRVAASTIADGYTVTVAGDLMAGRTHGLTVTISRHGDPVTDLQPYLGVYAHLTAFHAGNLAFAHLHPRGTAHGDHGGPVLTFDADLARAGQWRLFLQFRTEGVLHTTAISLRVSPAAPRKGQR